MKGKGSYADIVYIIHWAPTKGTLSDLAPEDMPKIQKKLERHGYTLVPDQGKAKE